MSDTKKKSGFKVPKLFTKKYTGTQYEKKILKKLFIAADRKLIESLFVSSKDSQGRELFTIDVAQIKDKAQAKRVAAIAKEIARQKGRFNIVAIALALVAVLALVLALTVFRNAIARFAVTSALEGSFGAKCDIASIDCNLLDASFRIDGLEVANRKSPMKNLFGVGRLDLAFDLLELTRGKVVADNLEITGITWNTDRKASGALTPAKQRKFEKRQNAKPNPVVAALKAEAEKVTSGISVDSGIDAVKDQLDPVKYLEREKAALQSPAIVEKISATVPSLSEKWEAKSKEVRSEVDKTIAAGKKLSALKVSSIDTLPEAQAALSDIKAASDSMKSSMELAKETTEDISTDAKIVKELSSEAEKAIKADSARLKALADTVKGLNVATGKDMISGVFRTFLVNTLGAYYPYLDQGVSALKTMQNGKEKKQSLKSKSNAIARLPGRNVVFGKDALPRLVLRNIELSATDVKSGIKGAGTVQNITDDADRLNTPIAVALALSHGKMKESVKGAVDLRSKATETVNAAFTATGYPVSIDSTGVSGVPSLKGSMKAVGSIVVARDGTVTIRSDLAVTQASLEVKKFEPSFVYGAYRDVLSSIKTVDADLTAVISPDGAIDLSVDSDVDREIARALKAQMAAQIEKVKAGIRKEADKYIAEQQSKYSSEIARFTDVYGKSQKSLEDMKAYEKTLNSKKAEVERKMKELTAEKAAPVLEKATESASKALKGFLP